MSKDEDKFGVRGTPPETHAEWAHVWEAVQKSHAGWPVVKPLLAIFGNWKVIGAGIIVMVAMGGQEILQAWGLWK